MKRIIMTNEMIIQIAMEQSAIDSNCKVEDFKQFQNVVTVSKENVNARRYLKLPHICDLTSYGDNIVATVDEKYIELFNLLDRYGIQSSLPILLEQYNEFKENGCKQVER